MKLKNQIKSLLKYVILAPSGYNSQPWRFKLGDDSLEILPDYSRARLNTDPEYREFYMSLGAAAYNLEIAAKHFGLLYQKTYNLDDKKQRYSILFKFIGTSLEPAESDLLSVISSRHTNRFPYQNEKISKELMIKIRSLPISDSVVCHLVTRPGDITAFAKLINYSYLLWTRQQAMIDELETWLRDDLESSPDGLPTGVINLYKMAINIKYLHHANDLKTELNSKKNQDLAKNAPALVIISTKKDTVSDWFQAGEFFELLVLTLASYGLSTDFFNYPLSLKKTRRDTAALLASSHLPQLLFRLGKVTVTTPRTPRYPLSKLLIS